MKRFTFILIAVVMTSGFSVAAAGANSYPIYPPGTSVQLEPSNFINIARATPGLPDVALLPGDNLAQHLYTLGAQSPAGSYVIGVLNGRIDTSFPGNIYMWLTSGWEYAGGPDELVMALGNWVGNSFVLDSDFVPASFYYTGEYVTVPSDSRGNGPIPYALNCSVTPLSDFHFTGDRYVNAIIMGKTNQLPSHVSAVAVDSFPVSNVPEPSTILLLVLGLAGRIMFRKRIEPQK